MLSRDQIKNIFEKFDNYNILCVGDIGIDKYIIGETNRISPEAPVPIVEVEKESEKLGCAGNVISNIVSLGGNATPCTIVGNDTDGNSIVDRLRNICLNQKKFPFLSDGVLIDYERPTTVKTRIFSDHQQLLRFDRESTKEIDSKLEKLIVEFIKDTILDYSAIIISDYLKGLLTHSLTQKIINYANKNKKLVYIDPKGSNYLKYKNANFLTPNLKELSKISKMDVDTEDKIYKAGIKLYHKLNLDGLIVTRGKDGISIIRNDGHKMFTLPTKAKEVYDVSGAGDTVMAMFTLSHLSGLSLEESGELANIAAGIVVGKIGTSSTNIDEILDYFNL
jgi:D-beta-D-heptose 7-phosphate kinase/D-beta-D-heptose 1-phosphate adenosyltransferase